MAVHVMEKTPTNELSQSDRGDLAKRIEQQIVLNTWGRIHRLEVEVTEHQVTVRGYTGSHYLKQLVLQGVLDILGADTAIPLALDIQVGSTERNVLQGDNDLWGIPHG